MKTCRNLPDVRSCIDRLDQMIVPLLAERAGYVAQAAKFKPDADSVVVTERIEEIVKKVRAMAEENGAAPDLLENLYRQMIDTYVAYEKDLVKARPEE